jgi:small subunit ribosomal protein S13
MVAFSFRDKMLAPNREFRSSLKKIFGVGHSRANWLASRFGLGYPYFSSFLNRYYMTNILGFLNYVLRSETKIRRDRELRQRTLQDLGHWRGRRQLLFLPTRGQRSRSNGRSQKRLKFKS